MKKLLTLLLVLVLASCHTYRSSIYGPYVVDECKASKYSKSKYKYYLKAIDDEKRKPWEPGRKVSFTTDVIYEKGDTLFLTTN